MYRWILALRWLRGRRINLLAMLGTTVGVWALIVVVSVFSGYLKAVQRHLQSSTADMTVTRIPQHVDFADLAAVLEADPNVAACAPRVVWQALIHPRGTAVGRPPPPTAVGELGADAPFVSIIGVDPERERRVTELSDWLAGVADPAHAVADPTAPFAAGEPDRPAIVLGRSRLVREDIGPGTAVRVTTAQWVLRANGEQQLEPKEREFVLAGAFETPYALFDGLNAFAAIDALREQLGRPSGFVNEVAVRVHDRGTSTATARRLERALAVEFPDARIPMRVDTWAETNAPVLSSYAHQRALMKLVLFVIMVVASFLMYATLSEMVAEKRRDIGVLTAMGATPRGVMSLFVTCGLGVTVLGTALGVVTGCLTAVRLDAFNTWLKATFDVDLFPVRIYNLRHVPYDLDPGWITQVAVAALVLGLLVAGIPAWRAAREDPLVTLRSE